MDKTLDDIIATRKTSRRGSGRRQSAKSQVLGSPASGPVTRARATATTKASATAPQPADKIIVSNLPTDVNEVQVRELFTTTVGPLRDVTLHYDSKGISKGVASVHFTRKGDGTKAYQQYNNRLIDGKRPMKIEIIVDPSRPAPATSLVSRVAPAATEGIPARGSGKPRRGRGGGGSSGGARKRTERPAKSAADLDAEMEDYTASASIAPAAAA